MKLELFTRVFHKRETPEVNSPLSVGASDQIFTEQIKSLRAKFEYKTDMQGLKVVGVTSAVAGEGKTLTVAHLAASLAQSKRRKVLLVDVDIRKRDLTRCMGLAHNPGLTDYLHGGRKLEQIVHPSPVPCLFLVSAGASVSSPGDLLAGPRFREFLSETRKDFDFILLDTPPVLVVADTVTLKDQIDGFLFLYRVSFTPANMFRNAVEEVGAKKILGVVLNGVEGEPKEYYERYYGHYYQPKTSGTDT